MFSKPTPNKLEKKWRCNPSVFWVAPPFSFDLVCISISSTKLTDIICIDKN